MFDRREAEADASSIAFDGRLDNRDDLLLRFRDILRRETSDPALALAAYEQGGAEGLAGLIGDWSLAIRDAARETVVLASDFAGVRPLYYCVQGNRAIWSTRLKPLVGKTRVSEIDDEYVAGLLKFGGCPHRTPYRGVYSVPPGHAVFLSRGGVRMQAFWQPPIGDTIRFRRESEYEEQLRGLFREAVRCRLRTDAPVLSELSGGLDSSSIVLMASHLIRLGQAETPRLATMSVEHAGSLDQRFYTAVEEACGIEGMHVSAAASPFLTETHAGGLRPAFWEQLHTRTAELARQIGAMTLLTGQLGDLIMGNWIDDSAQVAGLLRQGRLGPALKQSLAWSKVLRIPIYCVLWRALSGRGPLIDSPSASQDQEDSLTPGFRARTGLSEPNRFFSKAWTQAPPERKKHIRGLMEMIELRALQPPEPLEHLSYTHPFAHRPLVAYMLSIPADIVCRPGEPRRLMRRAFRELWPPELRKRRSKDLFDGVFLDSLRPLAGVLLQQLRRLQVVERGYVDPESLKKRLERLSHSLDCNAGQLRQIILLELWLRRRERGVEAESLTA